MIEELLNNKSYYEKNLLNKKVLLEQSKKNNSEIDLLKVEESYLNNLIKTIRDYRNRLKLLLTKTNTEKKTYEEERLNYIDSVITDALVDIFPTEGYRAHISFSTSTRDTAELTLIDKEGHELSPYVSNGKLMQYLCSTSSVTGIINSLGKNSLYVDEAFGVAHPSVLPEIGEFLDEKIKKGTQIILVSQNDAIYNGIPRKEFILKRNPVTKKTKLVDIVQYERGEM